MIKEFCAENFTDIPLAVQAGAHRIELCDNLAEGGTTPSLGVVHEAAKYCLDQQVDLMVIIRPRAGNFTYTDDEVSMMRYDIAAFQQLPITGLVLGAVKDGWIDEPVMEKLLKAAGDLPITFHMAFDAISTELQHLAIDWLVHHGVQRILTHGGSKEQPIQDHFPRLRDHIQYANDRIIILVGGGVTYQNAQSIVDELDILEVHGTKIVELKK